ncbi:MAG: hypothetical protein K2M89_06295 [Clostridiales bacterium]|nr:hypothetical protein [Clostridiales bacterium]
MTKKIKDLTLNDMPKCWDKLYHINPAFMCMFTDDEERFNYAKSTLPEDVGNMEIEVDND